MKKNSRQVEALRGVLHGTAARNEKALALLAFAQVPQSIGELTSLAAAHGVRDVAAWNLSQVLRRSVGKTILVDGKWELTAEGRGVASRFGFGEADPKVVAVMTNLADVVARLPSAETRAFLAEAVGCLEGGWYRAAVIMSWVAAFRILEDHVVATELPVFNAEVQRRYPKAIHVKNADDISKLGESDALDVMEKAGFVQKNVKAELKTCLDRRNACGHPNSYKLSELTAAHHVETLINNVFSKY